MGRGGPHLDVPGCGLHLHVQVVPGFLLREAREQVVLWVLLECGISCFLWAKLAQHIFIVAIVISIGI